MRADSPLPDIPEEGHAHGSTGPLNRSMEDGVIGEQQPSEHEQLEQEMLRQIMAQSRTEL